MTNWPSTTNYPYPCALVLWGGAEIGKRPKTRIAWITEHDIKNNRFKAYTSAGVDFNDARWTKAARWFQSHEIVEMWRGQLGTRANVPSPAAVQKRKRRMKVAVL